MALRYWITGGDGNFNSTSNWAATSGGIVTASVPNLADDAIWDANSGSGTVAINVESAVNSVDFRTFTGTVDFRDSLRVTRNIFLGATMSFTNSVGTPNLILTGSASGTMSSDGVAFPYRFTFQPSRATGAVTLVGNWRAKEVYLGSSSTPGSFTVNLNNFLVDTNMYNLSTSSRITGTTTFSMVGTGTYSTNHTQGDFVARLSINTPGTVTFAPGLVGGINNSLTWTYTTGSVVSAGTTLVANSATRLTLNPIVFDNLSFTGSSTITLGSDLNYNSNALIVNNGSKSFAGVGGIYKINHLGTGSFTNSTTFLIGFSDTVIFNFQGSGTINNVNPTGSWFFTPMIINTSGTYTFGNNFRFTSSVFTYTAGSVINNATNFLNILSDTTTLNGISPIQFATVSISPSQANLSINVIINDTLNCNTFLLSTEGAGAGASTSLSIRGSSGFICNDFIIQPTQSYTASFASGVDYKINNSIKNFGSPSPVVLNFKSTTASQPANFILAPGVTQEIGHMNFIDIDASKGQTLWVYGTVGTVSNCKNINRFTQLRSVGF